MKFVKRILKFVAVSATVAAMALAITGCSSKYSSLNEFMNSSAGIEIKNSIKQPSDGSKMEIKVEGNDKFVYQYTFSDQIEYTSDVKDLLEEELEKSSSTYIDIVDTLEEYVNNNNIIVVVRYVNADGSNIYEKEYTN